MYVCVCCNCSEHLTSVLFYLELFFQCLELTPETLSQITPTLCTLFETPECVLPNMGISRIKPCCSSVEGSCNYEL